MALIIYDEFSFQKKLPFLHRNQTQVWGQIHMHHVIYTQKNESTVSTLTVEYAFTLKYTNGYSTISLHVVVCTRFDFDDLEIRIAYTNAFCSFDFARRYVRALHRWPRHSRDISMRWCILVYDKFHLLTLANEFHVLTIFIVTLMWIIFRSSQRIFTFFASRKPWPDLRHGDIHTWDDRYVFRGTSQDTFSVEK